MGNLLIRILVLDTDEFSIVIFELTIENICSVILMAVLFEVNYNY